MSYEKPPTENCRKIKIVSVIWQMCPIKLFVTKMMGQKVNLCWFCVFYPNLGPENKKLVILEINYVFWFSMGRDELLVAWRSINCFKSIFHRIKKPLTFKICKFCNGYFVWRRSWINRPQTLESLSNFPPMLTRILLRTYF